MPSLALTCRHLPSPAVTCRNPPSSCCQAAIKLPSSCRQAAVKLPSSCCQAAVKLLSSCRQAAVTPSVPPPLVIRSPTVVRGVIGRLSSSCLLPHMRCRTCSHYCGVLCTSWVHPTVGRRGVRRRGVRRRGVRRRGVLRRHRSGTALWLLFGCSLAALWLLFGCSFANASFLLWNQ